MKVTCNIVDCKNLDRSSGECKLDVVKISTKKGCISYVRDMEYLREDLHRYIWYPYYDDWYKGLLPVEVKDDAEREK